MWTRQHSIPNENVNLNSLEAYQSLKPTDRDGFAYWAFTEFAIQGQRSDMDCVLAALRRMERRGVPVRAVDADVILSLNDGTTRFFNHSGFVPAESVIAEIERRS